MYIDWLFLRTSLVSSKARDVCRNKQYTTKMIAMTCMYKLNLTPTHTSFIVIGAKLYTLKREPGRKYRSVGLLVLVRGYGGPKVHFFEISIPKRNPEMNQPTGGLDHLSSLRHCTDSVKTMSSWDSRPLVLHTVLATKASFKLTAFSLQSSCM